MDFLKKFQDICQEIDKVVPKRPSKLFNIHKRSLPIGIDKVVIIGLTKDEAEKQINQVLKTKVYCDYADDTRTVIYYDMVAQDATPKEKSVFFNHSNLIKED